MSRLSKLKALAYLLPGVGECVYYKNRRETAEFLQEHLNEEEMNNLRTVDRKPGQTAAMVGAVRGFSIVYGAASALIVPFPAGAFLIASAACGYSSVTSLMYGCSSSVVGNYSKNGEVQIPTRSGRTITIR